MQQKHVIYVDLANARLTPSHLVIGTPTPRTNSGLHIQLAISETDGLVGF
jgi:hypothetical protein